MRVLVSENATRTLFHVSDGRGVAALLMGEHRAGQVSGLVPVALFVAGRPAENRAEPCQWDVRALPPTGGSGAQSDPTRTS